MGDFKTGMMTHAINGIRALDKAGWGRTGAAIGAGVGGTVGMFSDDTSMMGGAFKGAIVGAGAGRLARFGSSFVSKARSAEEMMQFNNSGVSLDKGEIAGNNLGFGGWHTNFRATAVGEML